MFLVYCLTAFNDLYGTRVYTRNATRQIGDTTGATTITFTGPGEQVHKFITTLIYISDVLAIRLCIYMYIVQLLLSWFVPSLQSFIVGVQILFKEAILRHAQRIITYFNLARSQPQWLA